MGRIGFLFELEDFRFDGKEVLINDERLDSNFVVVFVEREELQGNFIIGQTSFLKKDATYFSMDKFGDILPFLVFEKSCFKYGKVSLSDKGLVDFENLTFWVGVKKYREVLDLLNLRDFGVDLSEILKNRVLALLAIFEKSF